MPLFSVAGFDRALRMRLCFVKNCIFLVCILFMIVWTPSASGHAALLESNPAAGSLLAQAPREVTLKFNEPVSPLVFTLARPDGSTLKLSKQLPRAPGAGDPVESSVRSIENGLRVLLPSQEMPGAYALSWRVVSADGHPVGGTLVFSVGVAGDWSQGNAVSPTLTMRDGAVWLLRFLWYVGLLIGVGTVAVHALRGSRPGRYPTTLLAFSTPLSILSLGLLGVDALDLPLSGLWQWDAWLAAGRTSYAISIVFTVSSLLCAGLCLRMPSSFLSRAVAITAVILSGLALASSGHASSAPPSWLARPAVFIHGLAVIFWVGALWPLIHACGPAADFRLLRRFSALIPGVIAALAVSGATLIFLQFDRLSSLWNTAYGCVLLVKLALILVLLGLAALNRYRLTAAVLAGNDDARNRMRSVIRAELIVAILILAVVAIWRFTPPPRSLDTVPMPLPAVSAHIHAEQGMADLSLTPPRTAAPGRLTLFLSMPDLSLMPAQQVDVLFWNSEAGIQPLSFPAVLSDDGTWRVDAISLPGLSHWSLRIDVLISDFERISLETGLDLP